MLKYLILLLLPIFFGCATPQRKFTTTLDYLPWVKPQPKPTQGSEFSFVRNWNHVLLGDNAGEVNPGFTLTGTSPSNFYSFKLMGTVSPDHTTSTSFEATNLPEELQVLIPSDMPFARIKTVRKTRDIIVMPGVTFPLLRYDATLGFGSEEPKVPTNVELRTGVACDIRVHVNHNIYYLSLLGGSEKKLAMPSDISDNEYVSSITSLHWELAPAYADAILIVNGYETKVSIGVGVVSW